jgi:serine/threonine protein kinase
MHRNIKLENVMMTDDGHFEIIDFRLSKEVWSSFALQQSNAGTKLSFLSFSFFSNFSLFLFSFVFQKFSVASEVLQEKAFVLSLLFISLLFSRAFSFSFFFLFLLSLFFFLFSSFSFLLFFFFSFFSFYVVTYNSSLYVDIVPDGVMTQKLTHALVMQ